MVVTEGGRTAYLSVAAAALAAAGPRPGHRRRGRLPPQPDGDRRSRHGSWPSSPAAGSGSASAPRCAPTSSGATACRLRSPGSPAPGVRPGGEGHLPRLPRRGEARFEGEHWSLSFLPTAWSPGPIDVPDPPIDVAAVNPWMWQMAGEVADGVHVHPLHSRLPRRAGPAGAHRGAGGPTGPTIRFVLIVPVLPDRRRHRGGAGGDGGSWCARSSASTARPRPTPSSSNCSGSRVSAASSTRSLKQGDIAGQAARLTDEAVDQVTVRATWDEWPAPCRPLPGRPAHRLVAYLAEGMWKRDPGHAPALGRVPRPSAPDGDVDRRPVRETGTLPSARCITCIASGVATNRRSLVAAGGSSVGAHRAHEPTKVDTLCQGTGRHTSSPRATSTHQRHPGASPCPSAAAAQAAAWLANTSHATLGHTECAPAAGRRRWWDRRPMRPPANRARPRRVARAVTRRACGGATSGSPRPATTTAGTASSALAVAPRAGEARRRRRPGAPGAAPSSRRHRRRRRWPRRRRRGR